MWEAEKWPPKGIYFLIPEPVTVTLFGKKGRGFADVIKLMILRWGDCPALSRWVLSEITCILIHGGGQNEVLHTEREMWEQSRGRDTGLED